MVRVSQRLLLVDARFLWTSALTSMTWPIPLSIPVTRIDITVEAKCGVLSRRYIIEILRVGTSRMECRSKMRASEVDLTDMDGLTNPVLLSVPSSIYQNGTVNTRMYRNRLAKLN